MRLHRMPYANQAGMTLIEVTVATALFTVASVAAAHLLVWAMRALWASGLETVALGAAQSKMEELQSLAWHFDDLGNRISDRHTDLTVTPSSSAGGPGLAASPSNTLSENVAGYVDYLDRHGQWVGTGVDPPASATFVRRWAVRPMPAAPEDSVVLQVLVVPLASQRYASSTGTLSRQPGESSLTTVRTRMR